MAIDPYAQLTTDVTSLQSQLAALGTGLSAAVNDLTAALAALKASDPNLIGELTQLEGAAQALVRINAAVQAGQPAPAPAPSGPAAPPTGP